MPCGSSPRMRGTLGDAADQVAERRFIPAHAGNTGQPAARPLPQPVHPRACGEHTNKYNGMRVISGSSPRMRGTHRPRRLRSDANRFIPAHAGNTWLRRAGRSWQPVHPRACGEHWYRRPCSMAHAGSSPRMRGTHTPPRPPAPGRRFIPAHAGNTAPARPARRSAPVHPRACGEHAQALRAEHRVDRFIPAHAGNTAQLADEPRRQTVHPRACGEHSSGTITRAEYVGSSPRMRGTRSARRLRLACRRFIPAHAGNTSAARLAAATWPVHPRACGEHAGCQALAQHQDRFIPAHAGNTEQVGADFHVISVHPRACGEHGCGAPRRCSDPRFIPAHAGNTTAAPGCRPRASVHPRACGEHPLIGDLAAAAGGSSPRMRGTPSAKLPTGNPSRFIPAHAGNTGWVSGVIFITSVHPRACGEHVGGVNNAISGRGSSPRMRGTPPAFRRSSSRFRFIPAHAGNTRFGYFHGTESAGSSPRMRGTRRRKYRTRNMVRFIPAHAGNTTEITKRGRKPPVHPRACGEHCASEISNKG